MHSTQMEKRKGTRIYRLFGTEIKTTETATHFGETITKRWGTRKSVARKIKHAIRGTQMMKASGVHTGKINNTTILRFCKMMIIPKALYGLHPIR